MKSKGSHFLKIKFVNEGDQSKHIYTGININYTMIIVPQTGLLKLQQPSQECRGQVFRSKVDH